MKCFYRICPEGRRGKAKPAWITKEACLRNFLQAFKSHEIHFIVDNADDTLSDMISGCLADTPPWLTYIRQIEVGSGAKSFMTAVEMACEEDDETICYLCEDDFVHRPYAASILQEGIEHGFEYVTCYDHPDKYGGRLYWGGLSSTSVDYNQYQTAPEVKSADPEQTQVFYTRSSHWKLTDSTVGTFAVKAGTLRSDRRVWQNACEAPMIQDYHAFRCLKRKLASTIPAQSTHGETAWLAPLVDWESILKE